MNRKEIEETLKDYHWMINSIKIIRESMEDAGEGLTAQYGDESGQPKPQGGTQSDPVYQEVRRREKRWESVYKFEKKVKVIQEAINAISDDKEIEILNLILDGKSLRWIAKRINKSPSHVKRIKDSIVNQIESNGTNGTVGTDGTLLQGEKLTV
jgi:DNA-directed RNA polymerase specialized sigma subunit